MISGVLMVLQDKVMGVGVLVKGVTVCTGTGREERQGIGGEETGRREKEKCGAFYFVMELNFFLGKKKEIESVCVSDWREK